MLKMTAQTALQSPTVSETFVEKKTKEMSMLQIDSDGNGYINLAELGEVLEKVDIKLPNYKVRQLIADHDKIKDDRIDFQEFQSVSILCCTVVQVLVLFCMCSYFALKMLICHISLYIYCLVKHHNNGPS